ncbi:DUF982 domain-containing protein [Mesorhizobium sp. B2-4-16]|uniref:DUF982 domain-containing protein n=1 Tax=Mesorhizobium sp. B2-4-16 TaxID=2589933 RepID=UPI00112A8EBC|nr:DUF982 domain-containing protein [Mesorhizobium sp. B2-4-16]TPK90637.1 DUF982 domain-containing protein [Mesorhizobium sp. B2-4-16]TPL58321.1 DUF982 domain-containing protein [Mesorhizobium sp. B2-4-3]
MDMARVRASKVFFCSRGPGDPIEVALRQIRKNNACYIGGAGLSPAMANEKFDQPVTVVTELTGGGQETIADAVACLDFLLRRWRGKRSEKHRAAIQACADTNSGRRPASFARKAFIVAAREAAILVTS